MDRGGRQVLAVRATDGRLTRDAEETQVRRRVRRLLLTAVASCMVLSLLLCGLLVYLKPLTFESLRGGSIVETSVSPGGRWRIDVYYIDTGAGAFASGDGRAEVIDLTGDKAARTVYYGEPVGRLVRWRDANTVVLDGHAIDVRTQAYPARRSVGETFGWLLHVARSAVRFTAEEIGAMLDESGR